MHQRLGHRSTRSLIAGDNANVWEYVELRIDPEPFCTPKLYCMENFTTAEVMDKLDMFHSRFGKIDQFGLCDLERISADAGTQFTSTEFKDDCQTRGVSLTLAAPEHQ